MGIIKNEARKNAGDPSRCRKLNSQNSPPEFADMFTVELNSNAEPSDFIGSAARLLGRPDVVKERLESTQM